MIIKAVKFVEKGFYAQDFAFGGEGGEVDGNVLGLQPRRGGNGVGKLLGVVCDREISHEGGAFS